MKKRPPNMTHKKKFLRIMDSQTFQDPKIHNIQETTE